MLVVDDDLHYCSRSLLGIRQDSTVTPGAGKPWDVDKLSRRAGRQVVVGAMVRVPLETESEQESKCLIPMTMGKRLYLKLSTGNGRVAAVITHYYM